MHKFACTNVTQKRDKNNKRLQVAFTLARVHMDASFLSKRSPGPEEANFVS